MLKKIQKIRENINRKTGKNPRYAKNWGSELQILNNVYMSTVNYTNNQLITQSVGQLKLPYHVKNLTENHVFRSFSRPISRGFVSRNSSRNYLFWKFPTSSCFTCFAKCIIPFFASSFILPLFLSLPLIRRVYRRTSKHQMVFTRSISKWTFYRQLHRTVVPFKSSRRRLFKNLRRDGR